MKKELRAVLLSSAIGAIAAGCGGKSDNAAAEALAEKAIREQTGGKADVRIDGDTIRITTADGEITAGGAAAGVPESFPKDVHVYPGGRIDNAVSTPQSHMLTLRTADAPDKVVAAYKAKLTAAGWKEEVAADIQGQSMRSYSKDGRTVALSVGADDDGTHVIVTVENPR